MRRPTNGGTVPEVLKVSLKLKPEGTTGGMTFWWTTSEMATPLIVEEDYLGFEY